MRLSHSLPLVVICAASLLPAQGIITTAAGTGIGGFSGDGGPATAAMLYNPQSAAVDSAGNTYFADWVNFRIRQIAPNGVITTIGGNGTRGTTGDGGPALSASLGSVRQVAVDGGGHLCFGDQDAHKIRCITLSTGMIQGYGTGDNAYSGDGGNVAYASFEDPVGAAYDNAGNLFVADDVANCVRRVDAVTGTITTIAGPGPGFSGAPLGDGGPAISANLYFPTGLQYFGGALYIADQGNFRVRRVDQTTGIITTVAGSGSPYNSGDGGAATAAGLDPMWITADTAGNLFIVTGNQVREVDITGIISTIAGNGNSGSGADDIPATQTTFGGLNGVAWDPVAQRLLIVDGGNNRIRQIFYTPPTTTTLLVTPNPALPGQPVTLEATISPADATGSVRFYSNLLLGSTTVSNGTATFTWTPVGSNSYPVWAVYGGDPTHNLSMSATTTLNVQLASTTTSISSSVNPSVQGQAVTLTATVTPSAVTGSVEFDNGTNILGYGVLSGGTANLTTGTLPAGSNSVSAHYLGNSQYLGSTSAVLTQVVQTVTVTTLTGTPNPSTAGASVTLVATVNPSSATGTVQFFNGAALLGSVALSGGQAVFSLANLPTGTSSLTAVYDGNSTYAGSTSTVFSEVVRSATSTALIVSPDPSTFGAAVTLTAQVAPASATGTVQFFSSSTFVGSAILNNGQAQTVINSFPAGSFSLTAVYNGDSINGPSTSGAVLEIINKASSTTGISANPPSGTRQGQTVTFTATVAPAAATGVVQFLDGATLIGTANLSNGAAVFSTSALAAGNHSITASYGGDSNVNASQSGALLYRVKH